MNIYLKYQVSSFSHLPSPHPSPFMFQTVKCNHTEDLKSRGLTLNVASFKVNSVICLCQAQWHLRSRKLFQLPLCSGPQKFILKCIWKFYHNIYDLFFCPFCFSDTWINLVIVCERGGNVLIKASRELLHYFAISLLCGTFYGLGMDFITLR